MNCKSILSAILAVSFLAYSANAEDSFGNPEISIKKTFIPFELKNIKPDEALMQIDVFRLSNEKLNAFIGKLAEKANNQQQNIKNGVMVAFKDNRKNVKETGEAELFSYNSFNTAQKSNDGTVITMAIGKRDINGGIWINAGVAFVGKRDLDESAISKFLPPIDAPKLVVSIKKEFKNTNLTKECEEYIDTLKTKHGFTMPDDLKLFNEMYIANKQYDPETEHLFKAMAVKYEGDFEYSAVCKFENGKSTFGQTIERVKFQN
jgi:hypothetical protein